VHNNRNAWLNFGHKKIGVDRTLVPQFVERSRTNDPLTVSFAVAVAITLRPMRLSCGDIFNPLLPILGLPASPEQQFRIL